MTKQAHSPTEQTKRIDRFSLPDESGRFGPYGGSFVPETLCHPLRELNDAYLEAKRTRNSRGNLMNCLGLSPEDPRNFISRKGLAKDLGELRSISNVKTSCIQVPTKSTTPWDRPCWQSEWEKRGLLPKRELDSMG